MKNADYDALVARIEGMAGSPFYSMLVLGWALFGYAVICLAMLVLVGMLAGIGFIVFFSKNVWIAAKGVKLVIPVLATLWIAFKALWVQVPAVEGRRVTKRELPALFAMIERLRARGHAKRVDEVLISNELNAGVQENPRFGLLPVYKTSLVIGLPLMQATKPEELEAIIAHELGHLSRDHGRLASWIYRVRRAWFQVMAHVEAQGVPGGKMMWRFLHWYIPRFGAWSFVLARKHEYEADAFSAMCVGPRLAADALTRTWIASAIDDEVFWPELRKEVRLHMLPPPDVQARRAQQLLRASSHEKAGAWLDAALKRYTDTADTHPALRDRLKSLGQEARVPPHVVCSAADELLGDAHASLQEEMAAEWRANATPAWMQERENVEQAHARIAELGTKSERSDEEQLELARAHDRLDDDALALHAYTEYLGRVPEDADALFAVGRLRLSSGDHAGVEVIESAIRRDSDYAVVGYQMIASFHSREGQRADADRYLGEVEARVEKLDDIQREIDGLKKDDELVRDVLEPEVRQRLAQFLLERAEVERAWITRKPLDLSDVTLHVLVVQVKLGFWTTDSNAATQKIVNELVEAMPEAGALYVYATRGQRWIEKKAKAVEGSAIKG